MYRPDHYPQADARSMLSRLQPASVCWRKLISSFPCRLDNGQGESRQDGTGAVCPRRALAPAPKEIFRRLNARLLDLAGHVKNCNFELAVQRGDADDREDEV